MRIVALLVLALLPAKAIGAAAVPSPAWDAEDDDPKCARGECLPPRLSPLDEDDPKLSRDFRPPRPAPRLELGYRFLTMADPYGGGLPFHLFELSGLPVSGIFRLGLRLSAGGAMRYSAWMASVGLFIGVQYPHRVTPFLDVGIDAGVVGADIVARSVVSYQFRPTVEAGLSVYLAGRFHLTAAVGYTHPVYGGVDANAIEAAIKAGRSPSYDVQNFAYDTVTARAGLGF